MNFDLDPVTMMGRHVCRKVAIALAEPVGRYVVIAIRRTIARPFPRFDRLMASTEIRIVRWAHVQRIHQANARRAVETYGVVDDQIFEYVDPFDIVLDREIGLTLVLNQSRLQHQLAEYSESVPEHLLDSFAVQYPLCNADGKYNKQVLIAWLDEYQRKWDKLLAR